MSQPVILCGLGHVGWRVLEYLRAADLPVVAIDLHTRPDDPRLGGVHLIQGDFREQHILEEAGIATARGVLILTSDDLVNISAALMVRHLHSDVRVVVRMFNQNLIPRLGQAVTNVFGLSVSALTAPLLALSAMTGDALGAFGRDEHRRQVAELAIGANSHLRGQTIDGLAQKHNVMILAHTPAFGPERVLAQVEPAWPVSAGDRVVVCGRPKDLAHMFAQAREETLPHVRWASFLRRNGRVLWQTLAEVDLAVKLCTAVLLAVVAVSTLVYHLGVSKSVPDGLYRTISVMATGADMHEEELREPWHKVFVSFLRIAGAALTAAFTAIVTNYLLRMRLGSALEVRRIPDGGHIVVCGMGNIGFRVIEELMRNGERVVAVEVARDSRFLATGRRQGVPVIVGDATVQEVLRQANAASARAVVAATSNELANLEIALLAREINPKLRVVVRLADPHLARTFRDAANVRLALSVPTLAAPAFVAALYGDRVQTVFLIGEQLLAVVDLVVSPLDPYLLGYSVRGLALDHHLVAITLLREGASLDGDLMDHELQTGDTLTAIADLPDLERLLRRERLSADWAVDVTAYPESVRPRLADLMAARLGAALANGADGLEQLPFCAGTGLTRGQAEDLLVRVRRLGASALVRQTNRQPM